MVAEVLMLSDLHKTPVTLSISLKYSTSYSLTELSVKRVAMRMLVAVLSKSSTFPSFIWKGRFWLGQQLPNRRTYCWVFFGYRNSNPTLFWGCRVDRCHFLFGWAARFLAQRIWADPCSPYIPSALDFPLSIWSCTTDKPRFIRQMILVYIHELPTGLFLPRCHYPALDVAHAQMRFFAYFDYFFADLLGRLPLLQQMVALHYKQRI